jgi:peptide deformylase
VWGKEMIITNTTLLHTKSEKTSWAEVEELNVLKLLRDANKTAWTNGAGLAAIQIGIPIRFAWYRINKKDFYLINPAIIKTWGSEIQKEGCLSIPNVWTPKERAITIEYVSGGKKKKAHAFEARLIQHEIDHMNGILVTDKEVT